MTVIATSYLRGFFDPVTLGLHAPTDLEEIGKYRDDISLSDAATFVHELSHYLQFFGSTFGYSYLLAIRSSTVCLQDGMKSMAGTENLTFPASNWPIDIKELYATPEDMEFYTQSILMDRYYHEELRGFTYSHFGRNHPVIVDDHLILTSPLYLEVDGGGVFPFTGEALLENFAFSQETQFLSRAAPRDATFRLLDRTYGGLPWDLQARYTGIAAWLGALELLHIEPLIYFTLLNQPQEGFIERLGNYTLAFNTKKLLTAFRLLRALPRPKTSEETRTVLHEIAACAGLADPLDVLTKWKGILQPMAERDTNCWVVDWVSYRVWDWFLSEPLRILTWPEDMRSIVNSIPLLNLRFDNLPQGETLNLLNVPAETLRPDHLALLMSQHDYSERVYVVRGLYSQPEIRCPHFWRGKPSLCESCQVCSGSLPCDDIQQDCPVAKKYDDILALVRH